MAGKEKVTISLDPEVLAAADAAAAAAGENRSAHIERILTEAHYARQLSQVTEPAPTGDQQEQGLRALLTWQANPGGGALGQAA